MRFPASSNVSSFLGPSLGIDQMSAQGLMEESKTFGQNALEMAKTHGAGLNAQATVAAADKMGAAQTSAAQSSVNAGIFNSAMNIGSRFAGDIFGGGGRFGGGNVTTYDHTDPVNIGGKYYPMMNEDNNYNFDARFDY